MRGAASGGGLAGRARGGRGGPSRCGSPGSRCGRRSRTPGGCATRWAWRCRSASPRRSPSRCPTRWATWWRAGRARTGRSPPTRWRRGTGSASPWWRWRCGGSAADGRVAEGEFLPPRHGTQWCDGGVLRRCGGAAWPGCARRSSRSRPRRWAGSCPPGTGSRGSAGRPAAAGRRARPGGGWRRRADAGAVLEAIERLAGAPVPAAALETLVLPGRVPGYSPALLDELTSAGEVVWAGAGTVGTGDGWLVLTPGRVARRCCCPSRASRP